MDRSRSQRVRKRVSELVTAITAYKGLHLLDLPDVSLLKEVERLQAEIIEDVAGLVNLETCDLDCTIERAFVELGQRLQEYCSQANKLLGVQGDCSPSSLLSALKAGSIDPELHGGMLLILQAVARAYAEELKKYGVDWAGVTHRCPVCGTPSETMVKRGDEYRMVCHLCFYTWRVSRGIPTCPRCGATAPLDVGIATDKSRRIGLAHCQRCRYTWRALLDPYMRIPDTAAPIIALGAERFRPALEEAEEHI